MTEAELQEKIKGKLERKYGIRNVKITAGAAEHGVDIVFIFDRGEFGEALVIGIQLKAEANMGTTVAQKAVGQVVIALGHEFSVGDQHPKRLDLVYIANYGQYNQQASEYLMDAKRTIPNLLCLDKSWLDGYLADVEDVTDIVSEATHV